jgi:predicted phosphodiesterase
VDSLRTPCRDRRLADLALSGRSSALLYAGLFADITGKGRPMAIFITGDTHGGEDSRALRIWHRRQKQQLTKGDYLIIAGDSGVFWHQDYTIAFREWLSQLACTVLFIDGNHDDHWKLADLESREMFGADVGVACDNVYHLRRGRVYTICGKKVFTFGGAMSADQDTNKHNRKFGAGWWPEEVPSKEEFERGLDALIAVDWKVDLVVTHTAPLHYLQLLEWVDPLKKKDPTTRMLNRFHDLLSFDSWYCGHFHQDMEVGRLRIVMNDVVRA